MIDNENDNLDPQPQPEPAPEAQSQDGAAQEPIEHGGEAEDAQKGQPKGRPERSDKGRKPRLVLVHYGMMGMLGLFRHSEREIPSTGGWVVVNTDRGLELGRILSPYFHHKGTLDFTAEQVESYCKSSGDSYPLQQQGRVVRLATEQDLKEQARLYLQAEREFDFCKELIGKHNLPMRLVTVEHLFGGDRIVYYFTADGRVDFRELVKELAHEYQTRIELRQVGARDEARLMADLETCGRECCCKNFLKVLQPVNMRMAKVQKATLDPSKISGRCGRLKCCLRYEDEVYKDLSKNMPKNGSMVLTPNGPGKILEGQILTQLVRVRLDSGAIVALPIDELLERDYKPSPEDQAARSGQGPSRSGRGGSGGRGDRSRDTRSSENQSDSSAESASTESSASAAEQNTESSVENSDGDAPKKKRRRRRRRKPKTEGQGDTPEGSNSPGGSEGKDNRASSKPRSRRSGNRRPRKEGNTDQAGDGGQSDASNQGNDGGGQE